MKQIDGGITAPEGFRCASCAAGLKYHDRDDMALIVSGHDCVAAGVFTRNVVKAAPVLRDQKIVEAGDSVRAIIVNAGIANACTGEEGRLNCDNTARYAAERLGFREQEILVCSTGVIGAQLPMDRIYQGLDNLTAAQQDSRDAANRAAHAIITTDTHEKECAVLFLLDGKNCHIAAMAKGSGMIHPDMGTMLCFLTSDVAISRPLLQEALKEAADETLNMISVDGDTSTNDTMLILANGAAGNREITERGDDFAVFYEALLFVCKEMAMMLAGDGEGATALFEVTVRGANHKAAARKLARSVIGSSLTKAAIYGHDANWGRILCALGYAGEQFDPDKVTLDIEGEGERICLFADGKPQDYSEELATRILSAAHVRAIADLHMGGAEATAWGCDLSDEYVHINADYRS